MRFIPFHTVVLFVLMSSLAPTIPCPPNRNILLGLQSRNCTELHCPARCSTDDPPLQDDSVHRHGVHAMTDLGETVAFVYIQYAVPLPSLFSFNASCISLVSPVNLRRVMCGMIPSGQSEDLIYFCYHQSKNSVQCDRIIDLTMVPSTIYP